MKRFTIQIISAFLAVFFLAGALPVCAAEISAGALAHDLLLLEAEKDGVSDIQAWIDSLAETVGDGREWYVFALAASGERLDYSTYAKALNDYLSGKRVTNAVTGQKYALVLLACGYESDFVESTRNDSLGGLGVMSYIFGLHLANNGFAPDGVTKDEIIDSLLTLRRTDGGFSVTGETSDVDVTAMALQALAPYSNARGDVALVIEEALSLLSERQQENGGFLSYGAENPESASQVIAALCSLGIDPLSDERFIKNGNSAMDAILRFQTQEGGFSHTLGGNENTNATMQAFLAMTALDAFQNGGDPLYVLENGDPRIFLEDVPKAEETSKGASYRLPVILIILALALVVCVVLFLCKRKSPKSFLAVGIFAAIAVLIVLFTDFQSADSYYNGEAQMKKEVIGEVTLSIRCDILVGKTDSEYIPENGIILDTTVLKIENGDTVYDILTEGARTYRIQTETKGTDELVYVEGIAYLYELQFGDLSGWVYSVNGSSAAVGCGSYVLSDGDAIEWNYTLNLGKDVS